MDQRPTLTVGELQQELAQVNQFMQTLAYQQFKQDLQDEHDSITSETFRPAPNSLGEILTREQEIGKRQLITDYQSWFESWKESIESILRSKQTTITQS